MFKVIVNIKLEGLPAIYHWNGKSGTGLPSPKIHKHR